MASGRLAWMRRPAARRCCVPLALLASLGSVATSWAQAGGEAGAAAAGQVAAEQAQDDGKGDLSGWLLDGRGVLPVPIILTDPALGSGGGVAVVRFRRPRQAEEASGEAVQPHVYGIGAFRTSNGSKGAGAGAMLHFRDDAWRYMGLVAGMSMNLEYHTPDALQQLSRGIGYNIEGTVLAQGVRRRLGAGELYLGLQWLYMDLDVSFDVTSDAGLFRDHELSRRNSGLGLSLEHDTRDTMFTPSRGWLWAVDGVWYGEAIGSDGNFRTWRARAHAYAPLGERFVLGGRVDMRLAQGDVPFYRLPYIDLRGIGAARYQDTRAMVLETELRWNMTARWALVGFVGAGRAWGRHGDFGDVDEHVSRGAGVRYLLSTELGLYVGGDYAWGPEEDTFYVQIGSAWR